jgi:hypothetical protein
MSLLVLLLLIYLTLETRGKKKERVLISIDARLKFERKFPANGWLAFNLISRFLLIKTSDTLAHSLKCFNKKYERIEGSKKT